MSDGAIQLQSFSYAYPLESGWASRPWALREISFQIPEGQRVALLGLSEAGKTSLCLALKGIVPQLTGGRVSGHVTVAGNDAFRVPVAELAADVGMVFQEPETQFFNLTVEDEIAFGLENLNLPRPEMAERIGWALHLVGLEWARSRAPTELSGGEKQLVAIASVLAMRPRILVLDEPVSNLDPRGQEAVEKALGELAQLGPLTTIVSGVEHGWQARNCDRVLVLEDGRLAFDGSRDGFVVQETSAAGKFPAIRNEVMVLAGCLNRRTQSGFGFSHIDQAVQAIGRRIEGAEKNHS